MTYKAAAGYEGIDYVPRCEFVEAYFNGVYNGIYLLVERVDIESNKINIDEASADELTGGYLIEKDVWGKFDPEEDVWFNCIDFRKWDTFDTVCLKKYKEEEK